MSRLSKAIFLLVFPLATNAALVEYTYTGAAYDTAAGGPFNPVPIYQVGVDRITGSFVIDDADMVSLSGVNIIDDIVSFSFDDGGVGGPFPGTITDADVIAPSNVVLHTDAGGNILQWEFILIVDSVYRSMVWCNTGDGCTGSNPEKRDAVTNRSPTLTNTASSNTAGVWSGPVTVVPLPPAAALFLSAIGLLGWIRRK